MVTSALVDMDATEGLGCQRAHLRGDERAGVAALRAEPFVTEAAHQPEERFGDAAVGPAGLVDGPEKPWPGSEGMTRWKSLGHRTRRPSRASRVAGAAASRPRA